MHENAFSIKTVFFLRVRTILDMSVLNTAHLIPSGVLVMFYTTETEFEGICGDFKSGLERAFHSNIVFCFQNTLILKWTHAPALLPSPLSFSEL